MNFRSKIFAQPCDVKECKNPNPDIAKSGQKLLICNFAQTESPTQLLTD